MKVRGIQVGTQRTLVLDSVLYEHFKAGQYEFGYEVAPGNYSVAWVHNFDTGLKEYVHDYVMAFNGLQRGKDYDYIEFLRTFKELSRNIDYDGGEILWPAVDKNVTLDVRFSNLRPVTKEEDERCYKTQYQGVTWDADKRKWRAFLNGAETKSGNTRYLGNFLSDVTAAHRRDLVCVENGFPDSSLNFPRALYMDGSGSPININSIQDFRCRTNHTQLGYEAAIFDNPKLRKPILVLDKFYPTQEQAKEACEQYIKARFGPLSQAIYYDSQVITTKNLRPFCQKCGKLMPIGVVFLVATSKGSLKTCETCFNEADKSKSDLPNPEELLRNPNYFDSQFKICTKCGESKPATSDHFQTYKYKGEVRLKGECNICRSKRDKNRYHESKVT